MPLPSLRLPERERSMHVDLVHATLRRKGRQPANSSSTCHDVVEVLEPPLAELHGSRLTFRSGHKENVAWIAGLWTEYLSIATVRPI